jgi:two-component system response regulator (stage 0 sporulation protein A)
MIRTVENGQEAIVELERKTPDVFILDINMPIIDGFGVLEKYPPNKRKFLCIILTNFADENSRERAKELGADAYLIKSEMTVKSLLAEIERLLKK